MDYVTIIGLEYPEIEIHIIGDPNVYENIIWKTPEEIISVELLNLKILEASKMIKIKELSEMCQKFITAGFTSSALGSDMIYDSEEVDQINLIGAVSVTSPTPNNQMGYDSLYACRDVITGIKTYLTHTHFQLRAVMAAGAQFKLQKLEQFHVLRMLVQQQTELSKISQINWDTNPSTFS